MKSIAVYCGASAGINPGYSDGARELARALVNRNIALVYGGSNVGLMGVIADEVLRLGGEVTGVIPHKLIEREVAHMGLTRLHVVADMHERKSMMAELADGFIAMPGGMGTLEELFEMLTWSQLGIHNKPIGIFNTGGFYQKLIEFIEHLKSEGFVRPAHAAMLNIDDDAVALVQRISSAAAWPKRKLDTARLPKNSSS